MDGCIVGEWFVRDNKEEAMGSMGRCKTARVPCSGVAWGGSVLTTPLPVLAHHLPVPSIPLSASWLPS